LYCFLIRLIINLKRLIKLSRKNLGRERKKKKKEEKKKKRKKKKERGKREQENNEITFCEN